MSALCQPAYDGEYTKGAPSTHLMTLYGLPMIDDDNDNRKHVLSVLANPLVHKQVMKMFNRCTI